MQTQYIKYYTYTMYTHTYTIDIHIYIHTYTIYPNTNQQSNLLVAATKLKGPPAYTRFCGVKPTWNTGENFVK